jgi:ribose transport system permease protein
MNRILGVVILLLVMYGLLFAADAKNALTWSNQKDVLSQQALFGVLTIGVGILILTGGIDLSIGSVAGLSAVSFPVLIGKGFTPMQALGLVLLGGACIGVTHAALITRLKLQPFLVTLCGLFVYRGLARMVTRDQQVGIQTLLKELDALRDEGKLTVHQIKDVSKELEFLRTSLVGKDLSSELGFPMQIVVLVVLAAFAALVLHGSVLGRHWYAIGHNEQAAKYAGIRIEQNKFLVYVVCSMLASLGGVLGLLYYGSVTPTGFGESWELYAITGAVLGGCSLRGGDGTLPGMVLGAAVLPLLKNLINFVGELEWVREKVGRIDPVIPALIGLTLLLGTIADEFFRRRSTARKAT